MVTNRTIGELTSVLSWATERQKILNHNIANADTPNYLRRDLDFAQVLKEKRNRLPLKLTHPRHIAGSTHQGRFATTDWGVVRVDQNGVDLEVEMVTATQNAMYIQSLTQELNNQFRRLRLAIGGRG
ncbi:MAG: flagellar basal body rod protein FlgB [Firmicutes bacterium]|nr:flagellar basal body rod protein FlgB [Bacillota bacterium]